MMAIRVAIVHIPSRREQVLDNARPVEHIQSHTYVKLQSSLG